MPIIVVLKPWMWCPIEMWDSVQYKSTYFKNQV